MVAYCVLLYGVVVLTLHFGLAYTNTPTFAGDAATYAGDGATFTVFIPTAFGSILNITWTLNGSTLDLFTDITLERNQPTPQIRTLVLSDVNVNYDNTEVQCTIIVTATNNTLSCGPAQLLRVQGRLGQVDALSSQYNAATSTVQIIWSPPPALTVPLATRPERFYCVQVMYGDVMESRGCDGSMNEETSYLLENVTCGVNYTFTIIPINRIGNGTESSLLFPDAPQIMNRSCAEGNEANLTYRYPVSGLVCACSGEIVDGGGVVVCDPNIPEPGFLRLTVMATTNEDFDVNIAALNSRAKASILSEIKTFDVCDINITSTANSELDYSVVFIRGSNALGVLIILLFRTNGQIDFSLSIYFVQGRTGAEAPNELSGLFGDYTALAYDVEEDGEITSSLAADEEKINVTAGQSSATPGSLSLTSFGIDINCTSNITDDNRAVMVQCEYDTTMYNGFNAYIQSDQSDNNVSNLISSSSTESNSSVVVNGSTNGDHYVFVYPIWMPGSVISDNKMEPAYARIHDLEGFDSPITTIAPSDVTSNTSQDTSPTPSSDSSTDRTSDEGGSPTGGFSPNTAAIIGGSVALIIVIIVIAVVLILVWTVKRKKKKRVSVDFTDRSIMVDDKNRLSPSEHEMIAPVYESARPPPKTDSVKANGDSSAPPTESPPVPTDLYSVVDKTRPQEQMYETVQLKKPSNKKVEDVHMVEYATLQNLDSKPHTESSPEPPPIPARVEDSLSEPGQTYVRQVDCYEVLSGMAADWKVFAENLRVDEDFIDEIYTNNESDVGCLNHFLTSATQNRTKEDMAEALEKMGLMDEAKAVLKLPDRKLFYRQE